MVINKSAYSKLTLIWLALKFTYGLLFTLSGTVLILSIYWPWIYTKMTPAAVIPHTSLMMGIGIVEVLIGLILFSPYTKLGAILAAIWLSIIIINQIWMANYLDIVARDIVLFVGALALAGLSSVLQGIAPSQ